MSKAAEILEEALTAVTGDRAQSHGDIVETHETAAALWSVYLSRKYGVEIELTGADACLLEGLLKVARTMGGEFNRDDYRDLAGYAGCAGHCEEDRLSRWFPSKDQT